MPKQCPSCKMVTDVPAAHFYRSSARPDGFACWCKRCEKEKAQKYRKTTDVTKTATHKECRRCGEMKPLVGGFYKCSRLLDGLAVYCVACQKKAISVSRQKNGAEWNRKQAEKIDSNPQLRMKYRVLGLVRKAIARYDKMQKPESVTGEYWTAVGYSKKDLCAHLESLFLPGMGWHNMREWHIDHIRPVSSFTFESFGCPDFQACWALPNLRPLWARDNLVKGKKYTPGEAQ